MKLTTGYWLLPLLGASSPFAILTKIWNVESNATSRLMLVSPEVAENVHLMFVKQWNLVAR